MNTRGCLLASVTFLLAIVLISGITALTIGHFLTTSDTLSPADAIVVLSDGNNDFMRVEHGAHLFHEQYAPTLVLSNDATRYTALPCSPVQQSLAVAQVQGVPAGAVVVITGATSTYDEALQLRRQAQKHNWHSLILVTDPYHTRRAVRTFRTLLPDTTIYVSAAPNPDYIPSRWWQTEDGLVSTFNEILKLAFYWAKYGIAPVG